MSRNIELGNQIETLPPRTEAGYFFNEAQAESIFFALQKLTISEIGLDHSEDIVKRLKIKKEHYGARQSLATMNLIGSFKERLKIKQTYKDDYQKLNSPSSN